MTKSTVTNEQLKKLRDETIAAELMVSQTIVAVIDELLAVREAQSVPVASTTKSNIDAVLGGVSTVIWPVRCFKGETHVNLYTAPPAPAVPGEYIRDERGRMMLNGKFEPQIGFGKGWNACRAEMLAAAPTPTKAVNHGND
ncbi:hypothetical protein NJH77_21395 [Serratia fonticola]|uniref:hypothetical protein n=1 Tax=Serratia fonticola TaxID=47917 RepID=UPI00209838A9|nr:hypothetical protein [Serratia fonticola]MCO7511809.1 hypothetical protein [Serratia fonticola]